MLDIYYIFYYHSVHFNVFFFLINFFWSRGSRGQYTMRFASSQKSHIPCKIECHLYSVYICIIIIRYYLNYVYRYCTPLFILSAFLVNNRNLSVELILQHSTVAATRGYRRPGSLTSFPIFTRIQSPLSLRLEQKQKKREKSINSRLYTM